MRLFPASLITLLMVAEVRASSPSPEFNASAMGQPLQMDVAFVGRKVSLTRTDNFEIVQETLPTGEVRSQKIAMFDERYEARYDILHLVEGSVETPTLDFIAFDHYGEPAFAKSDPVLLFVTNFEGTWVHRKYLYYPVFETTDGDWAICGSPARRGHKDEVGETFVEPLAFLNKIEDAEGQVCTRGTRAHNIYLFQNLTRFAPQRRRTACNLEMGEPINIIVGSGPAPDAVQKAQTHARCVARREAEEAYSR